MATPPERRSDTDVARILIVDDQPAVLGMLSDFFTESGYTVTAAEDGDTALAAVRRLRPDVVLLDLLLRRTNGVEVLRRIHAVDATIPVIVLTGSAEAALAQTVVEMGAFDYLTKPFNLGDLNRAVVAAKLYGDRADAARRQAIAPVAGRAELSTLRDLSRRSRLEARLLFVVSPQRPNLYDSIRRAFGELERVEVIFDRRAVPAAGGGAAAPATERRRTSIDDDLSVLGWALVTRAS
ncbi:MAG: response regulator [Candidatus Rokuibacteriota bacterium]